MKKAAFFIYCNMKKLYIIFLFPFALILSCKKNTPENMICGKQKVISLQFQLPHEYSTKDTLFIDGIAFTHTHYADSIRYENKLPTNILIIAEMNEKQVKEPTNQIMMGRALGRHLTNTGNYQLLRAPELLTTGKLTFERKDGKAIEMCFPNNYGMTILKND
ncbi:MAG: hypothetical protein AAGL34_03615 [Bacteroidota bacterium]